MLERQFLKQEDEGSIPIKNQDFFFFFFFFFFYQILILIKWTFESTEESNFLQLNHTAQFNIQEQTEFSSVFTRYSFIEPNYHYEFN